MKSISFIGVLLLLLGVLAFVVPVPHSEDHSVKIGDSKIGVQTEHSEKLPPAVGAVLLVGGVVALAIGIRTT
jgi:drug/metabolite transporter (DMT)-like permease